MLVKNFVKKIFKNIETIKYTQQLLLDYKSKVVK